jgi:putative PIN family toxin of toxin-antitoxin system
MRVCFDTNCFVRIFSHASTFTKIRHALVRKQIVMLISNEILFEYREMIERQAPVPWQNYEALITTLATIGRLQTVSPQFRFHLIADDPDDDKFCDCAIAGEADFVVSYDRHLNALKDAGYKPQPITPDEFALLI